jgi:hypothetical protein
MGFGGQDVSTLAEAKLQHLERLDMSSNANITDITPLAVYAKQLR